MISLLLPITYTNLIFHPPLIACYGHQTILSRTINVLFPHARVSLEEEEEEEEEKRANLTSCMHEKKLEILAR